MTDPIRSLGLRRKLTARLREIIGNEQIERKELAAFALLMTRRDFLKTSGTPAVIGGLPPVFGAYIAFAPYGFVLQASVIVKSLTAPQPQGLSVVLVVGSGGRAHGDRRVVSRLENRFGATVTVVDDDALAGGLPAADLILLS